MSASGATHVPAPSASLGRRVGKGGHRHSAGGVSPGTEEDRGAARPELLRHGRRDGYGNRCGAEGMSPSGATHVPSPSVLSA